MLNVINTNLNIVDQVMMVLIKTFYHPGRLYDLTSKKGTVLKFSSVFFNPQINDKCSDASGLLILVVLVSANCKVLYPEERIKKEP